MLLIVESSIYIFCIVFHPKQQTRGLNINKSTSIKAGSTNYN